VGSNAGSNNVSGSVSVILAHPHGSPDLKALEDLARRVLSRENWFYHLEIVIADDAELRRLNRLFLQRDETTDVMAFPVDGDEGDGGEIYINLDQARVQALENSESVQKALARLLIHGILHIGGWSDATDEERNRMLRHGEKYLSGLG